MPAKKAKRKTKEDWRALDWTKSNADLGRELGVSQEAVRQQRNKLFPWNIFRKPTNAILEKNAKATAEKFGVPLKVARHWHLKAGKAAKRGFVLPKGFKPTTIHADAKRLGIAELTLWRHMKRRGIAPGRGKGRKGFSSRRFILPADFKPTSLSLDAERFGVSYVTISNAMKRQVIAPNPNKARPKRTIGWASTMENLTPAQREEHQDTDRPGWTWMLK